MSSASATPAIETVNVQVDGRWVKAPKGARVIEVLREEGVEVPHYCYHPKLSSPGNCRMCLVESGMPPRPKPGETLQPGEDGFLPISWMPRPMIACANTVTENMGIRTQSKLVEECRHGVMEFLLANHPLDCPICDQAGECRLQEHSYEHGKGSSQFVEDKVKKPKNVDIGPRVRLDDERCIMCSRCIRFCNEIAEEPVLGFTERGSFTTLTVHLGKRLENNYSLNTVDICPVGALTSNDFRFQMRVWFLKETDSICTKCGTGCNTTISSRENQVYRQTPRQNDDVNSTWMCDQGRLDFHYLSSEHRLTEPLLKSSQHHRQATWKEAVHVSTSVVKNFAAGEIAFIASARMTNEELWLVRQAAKLLGVEKVAVVARKGGADNYLRSDDLNPNTQGAKMILGEDCEEHLATVRNQVARREVKALFVFGENLLKAGFSYADLSQLDWMVSSHLLANPTADLSHVTLPGAGAAEKSGTMINATGRLQKLNAAAKAPGQARSDWEFLNEMVQALGGKKHLHVADVFAEFAEAHANISGIRFHSMCNGGVPVVETGAVIPLLEREKQRIAQGIIVG